MNVYAYIYWSGYAYILIPTHNIRLMLSKNIHEKYILSGLLNEYFAIEKYSLRRPGRMVGTVCTYLL